MEYSNREIAENLNLWNEYFNVDAGMTDDEFFAMTVEERLEMLDEAYPETQDEYEYDFLDTCGPYPEEDA